MRREPKNSLDQIFKNSFDQWEETPSPKVWKKIDQELNKDEKGAVLFPFSIRWAMAVLLLVGIGFLAGYFYSNHSFNHAAVGIDKQVIKSNIALHPEHTQEGINNEMASNSVLSTKTNHNPEQLYSQNLNEANKEVLLNTNVHRANSNAEEQQANLIPSMTPIKIRKTRLSFMGKQQELMKGMGGVSSVMENKTVSVPTDKEEKVFITKNNQIIELQIIGEKEISTSMNEEATIQEKDAVIEFNSLRHKVSGATGFFVGPNIGLNTANMYFAKQTIDPIFNNDSKFTLAAGYSFGFFGGYDFNKKLGLMSGLNFTRYNYGFLQIENDSKNEGELSIFQLEVPLVLRYKWNIEVGKKKRLMTLAALGGLKYSYITKYYMAARLFSQHANEVAFWHLDKLSENENHQLGYLLGFEANYFVKKNWYVYFNVCSAISTDISQFPIFLNNQLEKPSQLSIATNMGVRFQFNRNKKATKR